MRTIQVKFNYNKQVRYFFTNQDTFDAILRYLHTS
jgi:hypothetical protein